MCCTQKHIYIDKFCPNTKEYNDKLNELFGDVYAHTYTPDIHHGLGPDTMD